MSCWLCKQKAEWKNEQLKKALDEAKIKAILENKTMAVWKECCLWRIGSAEDATGKDRVQYVSGD